MCNKFGTRSKIVVEMSNSRRAKSGTPPMYLPTPHPCGHRAGFHHALCVGRSCFAQAPVEFTVAPSDAVPAALKNAGISLGDVDFHEINEAFSVVALANMQVGAPNSGEQQRLDGGCRVGAAKFKTGASKLRLVCVIFPGRGMGHAERHQ